MADSTIALEQPSRRWGTLAVIVVAQFMVILDVAIVNVALATIKNDLGFSQAGLQWVITAYAIVFGGFLLLGGRLADLLGRKRVFLAGVALFAVSSVLCGLAWSAGSLVAFRAIEGLAGAVLAPAGLSLLMTTFREGRDRNIALGIWGAASGSGGAVGVLVGGVLTSFLSWPWIFYINAPVAAMLLAFAPRLLRESRANLDTRHFDFAGAGSITAALMVLVYGLTHATNSGWGDGLTIGLLAGSALLALAFVAIEQRAASPLLPLRIFRIRTVAAANVVTVIVASIAFSEFFLLTLYLQQVLRYSAVQTGLAFSAIAVTIAVVSNAAQTLVTRFGARSVLTAGLLLAAGSLGLLTRLPEHGHYAADLLPAFLLNGIGMALCFVPVTIAALAGVAPSDAGIASGLTNTSRQVGGAVGLAVVNTIAAIYAGHHLGGGVSEAAALTHGFRVAFDVLTGLAITGAALAAIFLVPRPVAATETHAAAPERAPAAAAAEKAA
jgi:EmrB/QacA subfamily drug resistance transporter